MKKALLWFGVFILALLRSVWSLTATLALRFLPGLAFFLYKKARDSTLKSDNKPAGFNSSKQIEASMQTAVSHRTVSLSESVPPEAPKRHKKRSDFVTDFTVIDFETTGFNPKIHRVVEIGAVKFRNGEPVDKFRTYVNPKRKIPKAASEVNFITDDMVADKPTFYEVIDEFTCFIGDDPIVAHNAPFDLGFLQGYVERHKKNNPGFAFELNNKVIDTVKLARKHFPEAPNHKLETLKPMIGMSKYKSHTAADDCMVTGTLYLKCKERAEK